MLPQQPWHKEQKKVDILLDHSMSLQTDVLKDNLFDVYGCDAIFFVPTKNIVLIQYILLTEKRLFTQFLYCIFFLLG